MTKRENIDAILRDWPYDSSQVTVRIAKGEDGRELVQLRVEMGLMQMEMTGRPDGERPEGAETYFDYLIGLTQGDEDDFQLNEEQCSEVNREFVQFYHRRICWLALRKYKRAVKDADHTLGLMDFCRKHSPDQAWTMSHEQYRPFVLFHRTQAAALAELGGAGPETSIHEINEGLDRFRRFFSHYDREEQYDQDELVTRLTDLRESLREQFEVGRTLHERLADAVDAEQYELAAQLRDELTQRDASRH